MAEQSLKHSPCCRPTQTMLHHTSGVVSPCVVSAHLHASYYSLVWLVAGALLLSEYLDRLPFLIQNSPSRCHNRCTIEYSNPSESTTSSFCHLMRGLVGTLSSTIINMDPAQFRNQNQMQGSPTGHRYDESQVVSFLSTEKLSTFDGLPRRQPAPQFFTPWPSNIVSSNHSFAMPIAQGSTDWSCPSQKWNCSSYSATDLDDMSLANDLRYYSHYSSTFAGGLEDDALSRPHAEVEGIPRTWQLAYDTGMSSQSSQNPGNYEPSSYMIADVGDSKEETDSFLTMGPGVDYDQHESSRDFARLSISRSPKIENGVAFTEAAPPRLPSSVASDDGHSSREMTAVEFDDHGADEPYAKLIYRALMSAPNHSMVLQQIYQWFRDNTSKGSSDTKGWMNSIRHNLSMNAVSYN